MKRRTVLTGLGGFAISGSLILGTGAFSLTSAQRSVSVAIVDDDDAYLSLKERGDGGRSVKDESNNTIEFSIPGTDEDQYPTGDPTDPSGVGTDSVYRFGQDAAGNENGLFSIGNFGTQPVKVYSTQSTTDGIPSVSVFNVGNDNTLTESSPSGSISVGDQLNCGLEIDTSGVEIDNTDPYEVEIKIHAIAVSD